MYSPLFFRKIVEIEDLALWAAILVSCMYVPRGRASWFIAMGGERRENCPPVTRSLRSRRSYGKIGDCDKSNSISQKKQRYIIFVALFTTYQCMSFHLLCILLYMRMRTIPRYCYRPHWRHSCESWWSTRRYLHEKVESHKA